MNQPGHADGHGRDATRVPPEIDDEAGRFAEPRHRVFESPEDVHRIEPDVEGEVSDVAVYRALLVPHVLRGEVAELGGGALGLDPGHLHVALAVAAVVECDGHVLTDRPLDAILDREGLVVPEILGHRLGLGDLREDGGDVFALDLRDDPSGGDSGIGGRAGAHPGDHGLIVDHADLDPDLPDALAAGLGIVVHVVHLLGDDREVRDAQGADELAHGLAGPGHRLRRLDPGPERVANRLPVEAAQLRIPVLVPDRRPHVIERRDVGLACGGVEGGGGVDGVVGAGGVGTGAPGEGGERGEHGQTREGGETTTSGGARSVKPLRRHTVVLPAMAGRAACRRKPHSKWGPCARRSAHEDRRCRKRDPALMPARSARRSPSNRSTLAPRRDPAGRRGTDRQRRQR